MSSSSGASKHSAGAVGGARDALLQCSKRSRGLGSPFSHFVKERFPLVGPGASAPDRMKAIAAEWQSMGDAQRAPYVKQWIEAKDSGIDIADEDEVNLSLTIKNEKKLSSTAKMIANEVLRGFVNDLKTCAENGTSMLVPGIGSFVATPAKGTRTLQVMVKLPVRREVEEEPDV